ncbi:hypothetical protein DSM112329_04126 [Paraconexibacter sp. AEG42_29]|uniref:Amine oxidase domain-containing protein n=1 Tax=Paraconexibacter sp. AEG42_29 TaxID=2997339 RepID=A0AAU7B030_9ACTN
MTRPLVVVGGTIAALVAADGAAAAGREVVLLLPRQGVGGGFAPLTPDGRRLDRGLRALELHYEGTGSPPPLEDYDAAGAGHRPYAQQIAAFIRELAGPGLVELGRPRLWLRGRLGEELLTTCDLTGLLGYLTAAQAETIARQTAHGGAGLLDGARRHGLGDLDLGAASREQHGALFHDLVIAPLAAKLRPGGTDDVPAALRRKLWLPLFHPQTLHEAATGAPPAFRPERPFHGIEPGGTGELIARLTARLQASPRVAVRRTDGIERIERGRSGAVLITPRRSLPVHAAEPILALAPGELFAACGVPYAPERETSTLAWVEVAEDDVLTLPSFVHVVDSDVRVFRLSRGERRDGRITVCAELAHDVPKAFAASTAAAALTRLGLIRAGASVRPITAFAGPTFTAPTFANRARFGEARAAYDALGLDAQAIGGVEAFGADSLNEQLVQGLRAAQLAAHRPAAAAA